MKHERQKRAKRRTKTAIYDKFVKATVALFRKKSLALDLYIGETTGHRGNDIDVDDLMAIVGTHGILETVADTLHLTKLKGVNMSKVCGDIYDDLYEFENTDEYYWKHPDVESVENMTELVTRMVKHFHTALDVYVQLEESRGNRITDDPDDGIDDKIENPMLLRLQIARTTHNYDSSHCEFIHAGYSATRR